ncbi:hypothetical protein BZG36_03705, partial [Bifiguratus adelaidae]
MALSSSSSCSILVDKDPFVFRNTIARDGLVDSPLFPRLEKNERTIGAIWDYVTEKYPQRRVFGYRTIRNIHDINHEGKTWSKYELSDYRWINYAEAKQYTDGIAYQLQSWLGSADKALLFAKTSMDWMLFAISAMSSGITVATAYDSMPTEAVLHTLNETQAKVIYTDITLLDKVKDMCKQYKGTVKAVVYSGVPCEAKGVVEQFEGAELVHIDTLKESKNQPSTPVKAQSDDVAMIMYTSGSTGTPKGAQLTQGSIISVVSSAEMLISDFIGHGFGDIYVGYLPQAHVLEFMVEFTMVFMTVPIGYARVRTLMENVSGPGGQGEGKGDLQALRPTLMAGVPAIWERIRKGILHKVEAAGPVARWVFTTACDIKWRLLNMFGGESMFSRLLDRLVFSSVKQVTGGRLRYGLTGAAPISEETHKFVYSTLCTLLQGYGLTEVGGLGAITNPALGPQLGTMGSPSPSIDMRLVSVPDTSYSPETRTGELWIRGPSVMTGYYNQPDITAEALTEDRWFKTGDIARLNENGTISIVDRVKNLVKLAHGEYIALESLESKYRDNTQFKNLCIVAHNGKNSIMAVVEPKDPNMDPKELLASLQQTAKHHRMSKAETIQHVVAEGSDWMTNGYMTTSGKLKRKSIEQTHEKDIKDFYKTSSLALMHALWLALGLLTARGIAAPENIAGPNTVVFGGNVYSLGGNYTQENHQYFAASQAQDLSAVAWQNANETGAVQPYMNGIAFAGNNSIYIQDGISSAGNGVVTGQGVLLSYTPGANPAWKNAQLQTGSVYPRPRQYHTVVVNGDGSAAYMFGGAAQTSGPDVMPTQFYNDLWKIQFNGDGTYSWSQPMDTTYAPYLWRHTMNMVGDKIIILGGMSADTYKGELTTPMNAFSTALVFDITSYSRAYINTTTNTTTYTYINTMDVYNEDTFTWTLTFTAVPNPTATSAPQCSMSAFTTPVTEYPTGTPVPDNNVVLPGSANAAKIGAPIGTILFVALVAAAVFICYRRRQLYGSVFGRSGARKTTRSPRSRGKSSWLAAGSGALSGAASLFKRQRKSKTPYWIPATNLHDTELNRVSNNTDGYPFSTVQGQQKTPERAPRQNPTTATTYSGSTRVERRTRIWDGVRGSMTDNQRERERKKERAALLRAFCFVNVVVKDAVTWTLHGEEEQNELDKCKKTLDVVQRSNMALTSAGGVIALLQDPQPELKSYALQELNGLVSEFWAEIADFVSQIEILSEDPSFSESKLASLVASKVYYHLGEYDDSVQYALNAGDLFDINDHSEYVETIILKCIDKYIQLRIQQTEDEKVEIDSDLQDVVERMFKRCQEDGQYKQAIGIALEARRLDVVEQMINAGDSAALLSYVMEVSMTLVQNLEFRNKVLRLLVQLYENVKEPDYVAISQCLLHLNDFRACAQILRDLLNKQDDDSLLMAYQIAFDLEDSATQVFLQGVIADLQETFAPSGDDALNPDDKFVKIKSILSGDETIKLHVEFLYRNNHTDLLILKNTKNALESRNSVFHSAVTFANAFMNSGTTSDEFLRQNLEWLSRATNWSKFSATAGLGVIHKGQLSESLKLLQPYLPQEGVSGSPYSEGGALFALGLIHANHGDTVLDYIRKALSQTQTEVIQHGACLGLGVAGMATDNDEIYEQLKNVLFSDSAVASEAAGLAMGLVMLGTGSEKAIHEMLQYARETQHEKIIRGLAVGMALIMYGREEQADGIIEQLSEDKDAILRYGGIHALAMAYAGTGNNKAIRRLLHVAVSDVNDDVRRSAVIALGFILLRNHTQVPRVVQLLSESYNPHVRYGATLALGISCAGTGLMEAIELLEPMIKDPVDFVRQGALISLAMILAQQTDATNSKTGSIRKL